MRKNRLLLILLFIPLASALASPYENLEFALRQQAILQDLRAQCHAGSSLSDAALKKRFTDDAQSHTPITRAAAALKAKDQKLYHQRIAEVPCPSGLPSH